MVCFFYVPQGAAVFADQVSNDGEGRHYRVTTAKTFTDVMQDLEFAIGSHNYRITSGNQIGAAIATREHTEFADASVIHFCNLQIARQLLEISRDYLVHMPCRVVLWEEKGSVTIETPLVPEGLHEAADEMVKKINLKLVEIVDAAAEQWDSDADN